jgi:pilus assembly protein CpaC
MLGRVGRVRHLSRVGQREQVRRVARVDRATRVRRTLAILVLLIAVVGNAVIYATEGENVTLTVGRSMVLDTGRPIARVSLTSADVADALVTSANELLINGKTPGTISMFVWDRSGAIRRYEVVVQRDLARLSTQLQELFPGESISAQNNGRSIVLSGTVTAKEVIDRAVAVAAGYVEKKDDVVPLLQVQSTRSNQVLLHVRFAEVSRSAMTELGASFFTSPTGVKQTLGRVTTEQFPSVGFDEIKYTKPLGWAQDITSNSGKFTFSDFLNLFLFSEKYDLGLIIKALQTRGLFQSLAEPNLVAESGKEASFLAGGEIPVPVAQGSGGSIAISVQWKEFGIRLNFVPQVSGNRVHLKVRPEVSTLDFNNAVVLQGFRIPALSSRRTETELELENGQTFAIAGLLNNSMNTALQKIPGIGDIPILGLLFQSKAAQKNQTELVVMITPEILPNGSSGVTPNLPRLIEPYLGPPRKTLEPPPPAFRNPAGGPGAASAMPTTPAATPATPAVMPAEPAAAPTAAAPVPAAMPPAPAPAPAAMPADSAPAAKPDPKLAAAERKQQEKLKKETAEQEKRDAEAAREHAKHDEQAAKEQAKRDEKAAREKAKRDAVAAKQKAEVDKAAAEAAAKLAAEQAKKQEEIDKRQQKSLDEAQARLKAAEAAYQAELAKRGTRNQ